jgi:hypothetical protein
MTETEADMEQTLQPWSVAGSYYEVCNCEAICPCRRSGGAKGGRPIYPTCDFALSWWIKQGSAGGVELDGLKVVLAGRWDATPKDPWHVILYIDDRASAEQKAALTAVFLGRAGGAIAKGFPLNIVTVYAIKSASIELDHTRAKERIDIQPVLSVKTREAVPHDFTVTCGIPGHDHPGQEIVAEHFRYADADAPFDWDIRGKCGFATEFAYSS